MTRQIAILLTNTSTQTPTWIASPSTSQFGKYDVRMRTGLPVSLTSKLIESFVSRTLLTFTDAPPVGIFFTASCFDTRCQSFGPSTDRSTLHCDSSLNQSTAGRAQL